MKKNLAARKPEQGRGKRNAQFLNYARFRFDRYMWGLRMIWYTVWFGRINCAIKVQNRYDKTDQDKNSSNNEIGDCAVENASLGVRLSYKNVFPTVS